jgi:hypothetical protein
VAAFIPAIAAEIPDASGRVSIATGASAAVSFGVTSDTALASPVTRSRPAPLPRVTWFNHLNAEANTIALENDRRARKGPPADPRLRPEWRERFEDFVWSLVNSREFVWMP